MYAIKNIETSMKLYTGYRFIKINARKSSRFTYTIVKLTVLMCQSNDILLLKYHSIQNRYFCLNFFMRFLIELVYHSGHASENISTSLIRTLSCNSNVNVFLRFGQ